MTSAQVTTDVEASHLEGSKIEDIAKAIIAEDTIKDEDLKFVFELVSEMTPEKIVVSASETRQLRQYEPNQYHASVTIDMGGTADRIFDRVAKAAPENRAAVFTDCKRILYSLMAEQYKRNDDFLRSLFQKQQIEDGIKR